MFLCLFLVYFWGKFFTHLSKRATTGADARHQRTYKHRDAQNTVHLTGSRELADHDYRETSVISAPLKAADSRQQWSQLQFFSPRKSWWGWKQTCRGAFSFRRCFQYGYVCLGERACPLTSGNMCFPFVFGLLWQLWTPGNTLLRLYLVSFLWPAEVNTSTHLPSLRRGAVLAWGGLRTARPPFHVREPTNKSSVNPGMIICCREIPDQVEYF